MTGLTQITVPSDLLKNWEDRFHDDNENVDVLLIEAYEAGHRAGADQELEACLEWLNNTDVDDSQEAAKDLRASRRPKPPSLKEQALQALYRFDDAEGHDGLTQEQIAEDFVVIRRAIESLPD